MSRARRTAIVLALVAAWLVCPAATAWAHNTAVSTSPSDAEQVSTGPQRVEVRFDQPVGVKYNAVVVSGPNGGRWQDGKPEATGNTLSQRLRPLGPAGRYRVAWRALSADGHPVTGTFSFRLTQAGDGTPLPTGQETSASEQGAADADGGGPGWPVLAGGLVLGVLVLVAIVLGVAARTGAWRTPDDRYADEADEDGSDANAPAGDGEPVDADSDDDPWPDEPTDPPDEDRNA